MAAHGSDGGDRELLLLEPALNPLWTWITQGEEPSGGAIAGGALILGATVVHALRAGRAESRVSG